MVATGNQAGYRLARGCSRDDRDTDSFCAFDCITHTDPTQSRTTASFFIYSTHSYRSFIFSTLIAVVRKSFTFWITALKKDCKVSILGLLHLSCHHRRLILPIWKTTFFFFIGPFDHRSDPLNENRILLGHTKSHCLIAHRGCDSNLSSCDFTLFAIQF